MYEVGANQPMLAVQLSDPTLWWRVALQSAFDAVPIPANAQPAAGPDAEMTIWQPSTDKLWEFFEMQKKADGWHAAWGGAIQNVSQSPGYYTTSSWPGATLRLGRNRHQPSRRRWRDHPPGHPTRTHRPRACARASVPASRDLDMAGAAQRRDRHRPERDSRGSTAPPRPQPQPRRAASSSAHHDDRPGGPTLRNDRPRPDTSCHRPIRRKPHTTGLKPVLHERNTQPDRSLRRAMAGHIAAQLPMELARGAQDESPLVLEPRDGKSLDRLCRLIGQIAWTFTELANR